MGNDNCFENEPSNFRIGGYEFWGDDEHHLVLQRTYSTLFFLILVSTDNMTFNGLIWCFGVVVNRCELNDAFRCARGDEIVVRVQVWWWSWVGSGGMDLALGG